MAIRGVKGLVSWTYFLGLLLAIVPAGRADEDVAGMFAYGIL